MEKPTAPRASRGKPGCAAEQAWREHVVTLPCPRRWADVAEAFVQQLKTKRPNATLAVVLLSLDLVRDWASLVEGGWLYLVSAHRYVYYDGGGFGDARTFALLAKLFVWMCEEGLVDEAEMACLLSSLDDARESSGLPREHGPRVLDRVFRPGSVPELARRFAPTLDDGFLEDLVPSALRVLVTQVTDAGGRVHFGDLRVPGLVSLILTPSGARSPEAIVDASRTLLDILSRFYRWLVEWEYLAPATGHAIASELGMAAFRMAA